MMYVSGLAVVCGVFGVHVRAFACSGASLSPAGPDTACMLSNTIKQGCGHGFAHRAGEQDAAAAAGSTVAFAAAVDWILRDATETPGARLQ